MMRKPQNGSSTVGQSLRGTLSSPFIGASSECFSTSEPAFGISIA